MPKKPPPKRPAPAKPSARHRDALNRDVSEVVPPEAKESAEKALLAGLMPGLIKPVRPVRRRAPRKFNAATAGMICAAMRRGSGFARACELVGIHESTGHEWLSRGKQEGPGSPYYDFAREVVAIRAEYLSAIERGAWKGALNGDGYMQRWLLATQLPKEYGRGELSEYQKQRANQELLDALNLVMDPVTFREVVRAVSKLQGSNDGGG